MTDAAPPAGLRFLFRTDQGTVARRDWWRGAAILAAPLLVLTAGWKLLEPFANRSLDERNLVDAMTIVTYVYLIVYAFVVLLIAVSFFNLSAKRLRARRLPPGLAGLPPLAALCAGAAHWLHPRVSEVMPFAIVAGLDLALAASLLWIVFELGLREDRPA